MKDEGGVKVRLNYTGRNYDWLSFFCAELEGVGEFATGFLGKAGGEGLVEVVFVVKEAAEFCIEEFVFVAVG